MTQSHTYLWAVDPFGDKAGQVKVAKHLKELMRENSAEVEPTAVLTPGQLRLPKKVREAGQAKFTLLAEQQVNKMAQAAKLSQTTPPSLLFTESYSQRKGVKTLIEFAQEKKADLIALGTHARSGLNRWLLGSFAETLILQSPIPLLIVNPKNHVPQKIKTVLFATDLNESSRKGIEKLIPVLQSLKAQVILYHKIDYVLPETYSMIYRSDLYDQYLKQDEKDRYAKLEALENHLNDQGIATKIVIEDSPGFVPEAILKAAKKHRAQLIALVSQTGTPGATFLGSITRQVVRTAKCPVWTWHVF